MGSGFEPQAPHSLNWSDSLGAVIVVPAVPAGLPVLVRPGVPVLVRMDVGDTGRASAVGDHPVDAPGTGGPCRAPQTPDTPFSYR